MELTEVHAVLNDSLALGGNCLHKHLGGRPFRNYMECQAHTPHPEFCKVQRLQRAFLFFIYW